ncbi:MAG TPA: hypothetical protein VM077_00600 [Candidatus Limnocylindrales bacterium]|nr:hypothetical protein [Candidatus Limnocylindrales bacterium]
MSRNTLLAIIVLFVVLALILFSRRGTTTQSGFVSPTPVQGTINSEVTPIDAMEAQPTTEATTSPAAVTPSVVTTVSPAPTQ